MQAAEAVECINAPEGKGVAGQSDLMRTANRVIGNGDVAISRARRRWRKGDRDGAALALVKGIRQGAAGVGLREVTAAGDAVDGHRRSTRDGDGGGLLGAGGAKRLVAEGLAGRIDGERRRRQV